MMSKYQKGWREIKEERERIEELKKQLVKGLNSDKPKDILIGLSAYHTLRLLKRNKGREEN